MIRSLVTGGAGYLGSVLVPHLAREGFDVETLDYDAVGGATYVDDVRTYTPTRPYDICIHLAAITGLSDCEHQPDTAIATNRDAIARAVEQWPIERHIFVSTGGVYGTMQGDLTEEDAPSPQGVYCVTKAQSEEIVLGVGGTVFRLNHLTGMAPRMRWREIGNNLARESVRQKVLNIYDPDLWRPYTHVEDAAYIIARAAARICARRDLGGELFNVAAENHTKLDIGERLRERTGVVATYKTINVDKWNYRIGSDKLRRILGIGPDRSLFAAMDEVIEWARG